MKHRPFALVSIATLLLAGCYSYRPARTAAPPPVPLPADAWPVFATTEVEALAAVTPDAIQVPVYVRVERDDADTPSELELQFATWPITANRLDDRGLLRTWNEPGTGPDVIEELLVGFEATGRYVTDPAIAYRRGRRDAETRGRAAEGAEPWKQFAPATRPDGPSFADLQLGVGLEIRPPEPRDDPRGLLLHIPALFGNKYERAVLEALREEGWSIAHLASSVSVRDPNEPAIAEIEARIDARRFAILNEDSTVEARLDAMATRADRREAMEQYAEAGRRASEGLTVPDSGFAHRPGDDPAATGATVAAAVDERLAEHAYAASALVALTDELLPTLVDRPIVVVAFSAGALTAPTVAARLREAYGERLAALVMVGGGGDLLTVALTSDLSGGGITLEPEGGPPPDAAMIEAITAGYRAASRLDALAVAPALRGLPVLHVYASNDTTVATSAAEAFNAAHGGVDALVHQGSHLGMFYFLPGQSGRIARWIDAAVNATR